MTNWHYKTAHRHWQRVKLALKAHRHWQRVKLALKAHRHWQRVKLALKAHRHWHLKQHGPAAKLGVREARETDGCD